MRRYLATTCIWVGAVLALHAETATHREVRQLAAQDTTKCAGISAFCVNADGNLLVCDEKTPSIKVVGRDDRLLATWKLPFAPNAVCTGGGGVVFVGGDGEVVKLSADGAVLAKRDQISVSSRGKGYVADLCATGKDLFVVMRGQTGYQVVRMDHELEHQKVIATGLRGCCGQMDISAHGDDIVVAENSRHRIVRYDREGEKKLAWGQRSRGEEQGFGGCCNPMNVCVAGGIVYTAESVSPAARVSAYSLEGKYLGLVGSAEGPASCARVTIDLSPDRKTLYFLDRKSHVVRVLEKK